MAILLSKKEIERWQLDRFISFFPSFPKGPISASEEPDLIIHTESCRLGIELTDLYWEPAKNEVPRQAQESLWMRIAKAAKTAYSVLELAPLHVSIHFNQQHVLNKADVERLANAITDLVAKNVPPSGHCWSEEYDWENRDYFPEEITEISVWNLEGLDESIFTSPTAAFVPILTKDDIQRALLRKEAKLNQYRTRCNEAWLLINYDGGRLSTLFEHNEEAVQYAYKSNFDRIFLVGLGLGVVHELNVRRVA